MLTLSSFEEMKMPKLYIIMAEVSDIPKHIATIISILG